MRSSATSVVIAEGRALVRASVRALLATQPDLRVPAEASDGATLRAAVRHGRPDVVLLDSQLPGLEAAEAAHAIIAGSGGRTAVIVLACPDSDDGLEERIFAALRAGVRGCLFKDADAEELLRAVRSVAAGDAMLAPRVTRWLLPRFAAFGLRDAERVLDKLTRREHDVLLAVAAGCSNLQIAERLGLTEFTVKSYLYQLMQKLQLNSRTRLVVAAYETGLVRPGRHTEHEQDRVSVTVG